MDALSSSTEVEQTIAGSPLWRKSLWFSLLASPRSPYFQSHENTPWDIVGLAQQQQSGSHAQTSAQSWISWSASRGWMRRSMCLANSKWPKSHLAGRSSLTYWIAKCFRNYAYANCHLHCTLTQLPQERPLVYSLEQCTTAKWTMVAAWRVCHSLGYCHLN